MNKIEKDYFVIPIFLIVFFLNAANLAAGERIKKIRLQGAVKESTPQVVTVPELEDLPQTEYTVFNPYHKAKNKYKGILMKELVNIFGQPKVTRINIVAADGYHSEFTRKEWEKWDILFALRENGELMDSDRNGPVKVVMPYDTSPGMDKVYYEPKWIWAIKKIIFVK